MLIPPPDSRAADRVVNATPPPRKVSMRLLLALVFATALVGCSSNSNDSGPATSPTTTGVSPSLPNITIASPTATTTVTVPPCQDLVGKPVADVDVSCAHGVAGAFACFINGQHVGLYYRIPYGTDQVLYGRTGGLWKTGPHAINVQHTLGC